MKLRRCREGVMAGMRSDAVGRSRVGMAWVIGCARRTGGGPREDSQLPDLYAGFESGPDLGRGSSADWRRT